MDLLSCLVVISVVFVITVYLLEKFGVQWREGKLGRRKSRTRASKKKNPYTF